MPNQPVNSSNPANMPEADRPSKPSAILVLGMHRSGTSAVTGALGLLGPQMPSDPLPPVPDANATGYWESASIVVTHDRLLSEIGLRWDMPMLSAIGQHDILKQIDSASVNTDWVEQLARCVRDSFSLSDASAPPIVIKDPRMCRLVPLWKRVLKTLDTKPLFVLPIRNPSEVAASLKNRDGLELGKSLWIWLDHVLREEFETRGHPRVFLSYSSLLSDWKTTLSSVDRILGIDLRIQECAHKVDEFLSSTHRHHTADDNDLLTLPQIIIDAFKELDTAATHGREPNPEILDEIAREFDSICRLSGCWITDTQRELKQAQQTIHDLKEHAKSLTTDITDSRIEKDELLLDIDSLNLIRSKQEQQIEADEQTIQTAQSMLDQSRKETASAASQCDTLADQLKNAENSISIEQSAHNESKNELTLSRGETTQAETRAVMLDNELSTVLQSSTPAFALRKLRASHSSAPSRLTVLGRRSAFMLRMLRLASTRTDGLQTVRQIRSLMHDPSFDLVWYRDHYADVLASGLHPAEHFILHGQREGRAMSSAGILHIGSETASSDLHEPSERLIESARRVTNSSTKSFSIIMPTWNRKEVISRAIDSVISQSFGAWQLIIADDGSTDGTESFLRETYKELFESNKIVFLSAPHAGVSAARNLALEAATGDWIAYLDSDNEWHEHYLLITAGGYTRDNTLRTAYAALRVDDQATGRKFVRASSFNWAKLAAQNFIDLNIFSHDRTLYQELGGFDESLTRLVDWDLILRYTRQHAPKFNRPVLANYYIDQSLANISLTEPLETNKQIIDRRTLWDRIRANSEPLRLAYVLWDFPALSQTFVLREIKWMIEQGHDVKVYYKANPDKATALDFKVDSYRVKDHRELAKLLISHGRNWAHTHFLYPAGTLLLWPACEKAAIPFSIMPHAVDIFHHDNRKRNLVAEITASDLCKRIVVYGPHHRDFLIAQGADPKKFLFTLQASDAGMLAQGNPRKARQRTATDPLRVVSIGRFIDKKGFADLLQALHILKSKTNTKIELTLYGYGPLDAQLRDFCKQHALDNVRFANTFEGPQGLRDAFEHADVFCLPCVEADNGDVDGFPTVFIEAACYGLPILTTTVSAIPDYFNDGFTAALVEPNNPKALANRLQTLSHSSPKELDALAKRAHSWASKHTGPDRTGHRLLDIMTRPPIDLFMVTFHPDGLKDWASTSRAIQSVLTNTTTPYRLTIVDNASCGQATEKLRELVSQNPDNLRLIALDKNIGCGPASNIALARADSDLVIYLCSNEGYAMRVGWERALIETMRDHPQTAMGGQLVHSPAWSTGQTLSNHESFAEFRNADFAKANSTRTFRHIQGGIWALSKSIFEQHGGFNNKIPQSGMDVEYSFYLESLGHTRLDIPEIICISNKTRPTITAHLDETTAIAHPVFDKDIPIANACADPNARRCNLCNWIGNAQSIKDQPTPHAFICPKCQATSTDRASWRWLARSAMCHRNLTLAIIDHPNTPAFTKRFLEAANGVRVQIMQTTTLQDPALSRCDAILDATDSKETTTGFQPQPITHCSRMLGIGTHPLVALHPKSSSHPSIIVVAKAIDHPVQAQGPSKQAHPAVQAEISS
ncbi:MAG: glycosyltransferase [Phycisphaerales bacterium]|nr:glycosyltransferase [Phycisphaerales bacterium]